MLYYILPELIFRRVPNKGKKEKFNMKSQSFVFNSLDVFFTPPLSIYHMLLPIEVSWWYRTCFEVTSGLMGKVFNRNQETKKAKYRNLLKQLTSH